MSTSIDTAFVKQFEREVHSAYQRMGTKLRNTVRTSSNVKGASCTFQKVGKGTAMTKSSGGMVPVMNLEHTAVEVALQDYYAGDWLDKLDEIKLNHDERQVIASAGAYALGRKTDEMIINALASAKNAVSDDTTGMTKAKLLEAYEILGNAEVPDDGNGVRLCFWFHKTAIGHAIGAEVETDITWHGDRAAHFINNMMSQGAGLIDNDGVVIITCDETPSA